MSVSVGSALALGAPVFAGYGSFAGYGAVLASLPNVPMPAPVAEVRGSVVALVRVASVVAGAPVLGGADEAVEVGDGGFGVAFVGLADGVGLGFGATATEGSPSTLPSGPRKAGLPPGTIPSSRARRSSASGAA